MFKATLLRNRQGSTARSVFWQTQLAHVLSSKKDKLHCSAVKLGGVLEVVGSHCNFAVFFCMVFIVLCGFSHDSVLFLCYTAALENQRDICSVFLPLLVCFC